MRILVVDDEQPILELLGTLCSRDGHEAVLSLTAADALRELRMRTFDLLLTDLALPDLDGVALLRRAKTMQPEIMPIVITGHTGLHSLDDLLAAGAKDVILKPFRAPELRARLQLAEEQRRMVQQLKAQGRAIETSNAEVISGLEKALEEARQTVARLSDIVAGGDRTL
jgi:DNA-binding NtrC family response regulator